MLKKKSKEVVKDKLVIRKAWVEIHPIKSLKVKWKDKMGIVHTVIDVRSDCGGWDYLKKYCKEGGLKIVKKVKIKSKGKG